MKCYYCGAELTGNSKFCQECGKPQAFTPDQITAAAQGNEAALTDLYNQTYNSVYQTIHAMVQDEDTVQDLVQNTYIRAFQALGQLQQPAAFRGWLKRIAHNLTVDALRRKTPLLFTELNIPEDGTDPNFEEERTCALPQAALDQKETAHLMQQILNKLTAEQRAVVGMFYYQQMSIKEIAQYLCVSENTVKSRLRYARLKIQEEVLALEQQGTKLYGLAPIPFFMLLRNGAEAALTVPAPQVLPGVLQSLRTGAAVAQKVAAQQPVVQQPVTQQPVTQQPVVQQPAQYGAAAAKEATGAAGKTAAKAVTGTAGKTAAKAVSGKMIAIIAAGVVAVGGLTTAGILLATNAGNTPEPQPGFVVQTPAPTAEPTPSPTPEAPTPSPEPPAVVEDLQLGELQNYLDKAITFYGEWIFDASGKIDPKYQDWEKYPGYDEATGTSYYYPLAQGLPKSEEELCALGAEIFDESLARALVVEYSSIIEQDGQLMTTKLSGMGGPGYYCNALVYKEDESHYRFDLNYVSETDYNYRNTCSMQLVRTEAGWRFMGDVDEVIEPLLAGSWSGGYIISGVYGLGSPTDTSQMVRDGFAQEIITEHNWEYRFNVPEILLDTPGADAINQKIQEICMTQVEEAIAYIQEDPRHQPNINGVEWEAHLAEDVLSVVLVIHTPYSFTDRMVFCMNVETGEEMSTLDVAEYLGMDEDRYEYAVLRSLDTHFITSMPPQKAEEFGIDNDFYWEQWGKTVDEENIQRAQLYLTENCEPHIIAPIYAFAGGDYYLQSVLLGNIPEAEE